jgi:hypothetical protein
MVLFCLVSSKESEGQLTCCVRPSTGTSSNDTTTPTADADKNSFAKTKKIC